MTVGIALIAGGVLVWIFLIYRIQRAERRLQGVSEAYEPRYHRDRLP